MYADEGKPPPREMMQITSAYNRGIVWYGVPIEAIRLAYEKYGYPLTGEKVKDGFEMIKNLTLGGIVPPLEITPDDHEGGGWVQLAEVKNGKFVKGIDWFHGFREEVLAQVAEAAKAGD
jgi:branched-chain amino acid transport system substrate-binding protein